MDVINELELRDLLKSKLSPQDLLAKVVRRAMDEKKPWEERRAYWLYLYRSGHLATLATLFTQGLRDKTRVPLDLFMRITSETDLRPTAMVLSGMRKGLKKQEALEELMVHSAWPTHDPRLKEMRDHFAQVKAEEAKRFKENMIDKFEFLIAQRMTEQAGRVLRRLLEIFPADEALKKRKSQFEEEWARNVLSTHMAQLGNARIEHTKTAPSRSLDNILRTLANTVERLCFERRESAADFAMMFWFMDDFAHALDAIAWAPPSRANDWLKAELLFAGRRLIEALDFLNQLELRYITDPETTFSVSYLRAQCLYQLGQKDAALEILQSIVRVRPNYRSAHALILDWSEGVNWE